MIRIEIVICDINICSVCEGYPDGGIPDLQVSNADPGAIGHNELSHRDSINIEIAAISVVVQGFVFNNIIGGYVVRIVVG